MAQFDRGKTKPPNNSWNTLMECEWTTTVLRDLEEVIRVLRDLRGKSWLYRGQPEPHGSLVPTIDRNGREDLTRSDKLKLERRSIDLFQKSARYFANSGEERALDDDIITLMVLRHYEVPTRLLDWSGSPYVAAYFAASERLDEPGEIWGFDEPLYEEVGKEQWDKFPETTINGEFRAQITAFTKEEPPDWFICAFYKEGFPRQLVQQGAYSMTAQFGRDHAVAIMNLLQEPSAHSRWILDARLKSELLKWLAEEHEISRASLFPDTAGAANTAKTAFDPPM